MQRVQQCPEFLLRAGDSAARIPMQLRMTAGSSRPSVAAIWRQELIGDVLLQGRRAQPASSVGPHAALLDQAEESALGAQAITSDLLRLRRAGIHRCRVGSSPSNSPTAGTWAAAQS